jgi:protein SCO1/2
MKRLVLVLLLLLAALACSKEEPKPVSEPGEKIYTVRGKILSRDAAQNSVKMDHEEIPGFMAAMVMDYNVRGAEVATLPPDGSRVEAVLHATERSYWITDVRAAP